MTKSVDPKKASGYITKAEGFLEIANLALQKNKYDSAVMNAGRALMFSKGYRPKGRDHQFYETFWWDQVAKCDQENFYCALIILLVIILQE